MRVLAHTCKIMFNTGGLLGNARVDIYKTDVATDSRGSITSVPTLKYENVIAKIESKEVEVPISYNGATYRHFYLMMTWTDANGEIYLLRDGDIVIDTTNNKKYKVMISKPGTLVSMKPYKAETDMIVLADDRYDNNLIPI